MIAGASALGAGSAPAASTTCATPQPAGNHTVTLTVGGRRRTTIVHAPGTVGTQRVPLVLALHGYGSNGWRMEHYAGFDQLADRYNFLVAYPSSSGKLWNSIAKRTWPDDIRFLAALIDYLDRTQCVDSHRVFATGVSNGGSMVALAGCQLSRRLAGIAPVAGDYSRQPACRPTHPVSLLEIHGTADQVVPYFGPTKRPTPDGLPPYVNGWVHRDSCSKVPAESNFARRTTSYLWHGCAGGTVVEHIKILHGEHQWPGATPPDPGPPSTFCASCTIWSFFSALRTGARVYSSNGAAAPAVR